MVPWTRVIVPVRVFGAKGRSRRPAPLGASGALGLWQFVPSIVTLATGSKPLAESAQGRRLGSAAALKNHESEKG
jgi:hypothetical protein